MGSISNCTEPVEIIIRSSAIHANDVSLSLYIYIYIYILKTQNFRLVYLLFAYLTSLGKLHSKHKSLFPFTAKIHQKRRRKNDQKEETLLCFAPRRCPYSIHSALMHAQNLTRNNQFDAAIQECELAT